VRRRYVRIALLITASLLTGALIFVGSFFALDFIWTHFVVTDPAQVSVGDGVVVVGGGFVLGTVLGLGALSFVLYRFWPRKQN
jgi:hypothetical protein